MSEKVKIALVIIGAIIIFRFFNRFFKPDQSGGTAVNLPVNQNKLTYEPNQYKVFADEIEASIWGTGFIEQVYEDDENVARILKLMRTTDDIYTLINEYGERYVGVILKKGGNLVQTINEYLDTDLLDDVNTYYKSKNINFQF